MAERGKEQKRHYSEKGGHFVRGSFARIQSEIDKIFPDVHMRHVPAPVREWRIRRNMFRDPRSGRR